MDMKSRPMINERVSWKDFKQKVITDTGHAMNDVGSEIWKLCDGKHTIRQIVDSITQNFDVSVRQAEKDVLSFLRELEEANLVSLK